MNPTTTASGSFLGTAPANLFFAKGGVPTSADPSYSYVSAPYVNIGDLATVSFMDLENLVHVKPAQFGEHPEIAFTDSEIFDILIHKGGCMNRTIPREEIVWLACLLEAEGNISICRSNRINGKIYYAVSVGIYNTELALIDKARRTIESIIGKETRLWKRYGKEWRNKKGNKSKALGQKEQFFMFLNTREDVSKLLSEISPFLVGRKKSKVEKILYALSNDKHLVKGCLLEKVWQEQSRIPVETTTAGSSKEDDGIVRTTGQPVEVAEMTTRLMQ